MPFPALIAAMPGTSIALPQVPLLSLATNARERPALSSRSPPAEQVPDEGHDTEVTTALPPVLSAPAPGASTASTHPVKLLVAVTRPDRVVALAYPDSKSGSPIGHNFLTVPMLLATCVPPAQRD